MARAQLAAFALARHGAQRAIRLGALSAAHLLTFTFSLTLIRSCQNHNF